MEYTHLGLWKIISIAVLDSHFKLFIWWKSFEYILYQARGKLCKELIEIFEKSRMLRAWSIVE